MKRIIAIIGVLAAATSITASLLAGGAKSQTLEPRACTSPTGPRTEATRIVNGTTADGGLETTEWLEEPDVYKVSRCTSDATFTGSQLVITAPAPGNRTVRRVAERLERDASGQWVETTQTPGGVDEEYVKEAWRVHGQKLAAAAWPPTD